MDSPTDSPPVDPTAVDPSALPSVGEAVALPPVPEPVADDTVFVTSSGEEFTAADVLELAPSADLPTAPVDSSEKPTDDQIAEGAALNATFDPSAPSVAPDVPGEPTAEVPAIPEPADPSTEVIAGRALSIEEALIDQLGIGGVVDVQANGFRVKVGGRAQFGHGRSIAEALYDLANPAKLA